MHEDESEPLQPIEVRGEIIDSSVDVDDADFDIRLENFDTRVHVKLIAEVRSLLGEDSLDEGEHVLLVGHYGGEGGEEIATFIASQLHVLDPETEIDATKMATVGEHVEHKANGKRRRK